jgi:hypothetical protein
VKKNSEFYNIAIFFVPNNVSHRRATFRVDGPEFSAINSGGRDAAQSAAYEEGRETHLEAPLCQVLSLLALLVQEYKH